MSPAVGPLAADLLPSGVRSRFVEGVNGLRLHILEAGHETAGRPLILLLHGFPELAYSWRKVIAPLADLGFHVVAPDQRGYGRTTGADASYLADLSQYGMLNLARDVAGLVFALGHGGAACVVGHDFGSPVAAWCALIRPDIFRAAVLMSAPFAGPPNLPFDTDAHPPAPGPSPLAALDAGLAALPRPRKHYHAWYCTAEADPDMRGAPGGLAAFLRAYYHVKSADWPHNRPHRLAGWTAEGLARLPTYYVMDLADGMAATVAHHAPSPAQAGAWLSEAELAVYAAEFTRTGFQGGLNWYRAARDPRLAAGLQLFSGRAIEVPACFIAGAADWGVFQSPGAYERMGESGCADLRDRHLIEGAGHWVQQERAEAVLGHLELFLGGLAAA